MSFGTIDTDDQEIMNEINMTPLVDVMLVLLIIFIVTVPVMKHAVEVNIPQASSQPENVKPETIRLQVDANGNYSLDKEKLSKEQLALQLKTMAKSNPQPVLHIYGDKKVAYEFVATAMSLANSAGLQKVGFVTNPGN
jgi:biopolymer transport protein ExbD